MGATKTYRMTPEQIVELVCDAADSFIDEPGMDELLMGTMLHMLAKALSNYHSKTDFPEDLVVIWMAAIAAELKEALSPDDLEERILH